MIDENDRQLTGFGRRTEAAWLRVTGSDALAFLQGQFTQELRPPLAPPVQYGLWLNQKGRVLADGQVIRCSAEEFWISSLESPAQVLRERLEAYLIADDVVVEPCSDGWSQWLLAGSEGRAWCERNGIDAPAPGQLARRDGGFVFPARFGPHPAWELRLPAGDSRAPTAATLNRESIERARIAAGVPSIPRDLGPTDLPAEGGLEEAAISFTKGCYLGQEVVARLRSMGRVRRQLFLLASPDGEPAAPGAALFQGERRVGETRSTVASEDGGWVGFGMLTLAGLEMNLPLSLDPAAPARITPTSLAS